MLLCGGRRGAGDQEKGGRRCMGGGIPKVAGSRRKRKRITTLGLYFAIGKMRRGGANKYRTGTQGMKGYRK